MFLISRTGVINQSVFVRLTISGTAANGSDYQSIFAFVNLQATETSKLIEIRPQPTATLAGGVESVVLTLNHDPSYRIGSPAGARALIAEEQLSLARWRNLHFPNDSGDLATFAQSDPDGFGIANLARYALVLDPYSPGTDPATLPRMDIVDGHMTLTFKTQPAATDLQYVVEVSRDLKTWRSGSDAVQNITPFLSNADPKVAVYRSQLSTEDADTLFMRIQILHQP